MSLYQYNGNNNDGDNYMCELHGKKLAENK